MREVNLVAEWMFVPRFDSAAQIVLNVVGIFVWLVGTACAGRQ
jgi:hypothetical protein